MMFIRLFISLLLFLFAVSEFCYANEIDENRDAIDYLKGLDIEDLLDVEVMLDDVFNVFDGLIKARKITVATGEKQSMARAPSVTTVITAQDIEATGARDLDEVLETVPGLHVTRTDVRYMPIYLIRGNASFGNPEVLILVNGVSINTLGGSKGGVWGGMPLNAIARIEIIRGPGSAVYGADAYSGVINIITKRKNDIDGTEAGIRVGSFDTREAWILHGEEWAGFDVAVALDYHTTEGHRKIIETDAQTQFDKQPPGTSASFAPGSANLQRHNIDARLDVSRGNWQLRTGYQRRRNHGTGTVGLGYALDPIGRWSSDRFSADLTYHNPEFTQYWDVTTQLSYYRHAWGTENFMRIYPPGAFGGAYPDGFIGNPGESQSNTRLELSGFYSGFNRHLIRVGTGYHYADLYKITDTKNFGVDPATGLPLPPGGPVIDVSDTPLAYLPELDRKSWYLYLQDIWAFAPDWELTAGVRYDEYSDFGSTVNPRLALVWQARPELTTKLLYGSAFRAPAPGELFVTNNPVQLGNPDLKPETIDTWELAFDYRAMENLHLALNLFSYKASDKIIWESNAETSTGKAQNAGVQKGHGLEWEARWKMTKRSSLLANYAFTKATNENKDHDVGYYPQHSAFLRTDWLLYPNWYLDAQVNWIADRQRSFGDSRPAIDDYTTVDLTLRRKDIREGQWNLAVSVRNLFDVDAREPTWGFDSSGVAYVPNDIPLAGRNYFLELRYRF